MKKLYLLFLSFFISPTFGETISDFSNMCAPTGYKRLYAVLQKNEYTCLPGYFLPADAETCVACPSGYTCSGGTFYYNATDAQGLTKNSQNSYVSATNACASNTVPKRLYAIMTPITYTCSPGQFLPADAETCVACPSGYTCDGGNFPVNTTTAQGLVRNSDYISDTITNACADNQVRALNAVFTINSYTCSAGYYLPADAEGCVECIANNYCPGGQLTFNETTPQGLNPCPNDTPYSPTGSISANQCYKIINLNWYLDENAITPLTVQPLAQQCIYGQTITLPDTPTRTGYTFTGWRLKTDN